MCAFKYRVSASTTYFGEGETTPAPTRFTLAKLRSGYSKYLNSYMARINPHISEICPPCCSSSHTTRHLFECPQRPSSQTPLSLWTETVEAGSLHWIWGTNNSTLSKFPKSIPFHFSSPTFLPVHITYTSRISYNNHSDNQHGR